MFAVGIILFNKVHILRHSGLDRGHFEVMIKRRDWMVAARKAKGYATQAEFAKDINIAKSYLSAIESGERTPSGKTALKIANALDVKMDMFFLDEIKEGISK